MSKVNATYPTRQRMLLSIRYEYKFNVLIREISSVLLPKIFSLQKIIQAWCYNSQKRNLRTTRVLLKTLMGMWQL